MLLQSSTVGSPFVFWRRTSVWMLAGATLAGLIPACGRAAETGIGEAAQTPTHTRQTPWAPKLYAFDFEASDAKRRSLAEEARMLRELGFDGVGYLLWLDQPAPKLRLLGEDLEANLRTLDEAGLPLLGVGASVNVDPNVPRPYDQRLVDAIRTLTGRRLMVEVMLDGLPPGDKRGEKPAVQALRELGDLAAKSNLRISVYHHVNSWARSFDDALRVVKQANHPRVGVNFNVAHWLMVEGARDYRPVLRAGGEKIFVVTINGAKVGATEIPELIQPLGQGDFDNRQLLATLRDVGYQGSIGLQCFGIPGDARQHLQRSMKVWKAWKAEWANESR